MPLPEGYLPRKGDVLVLHATVKYDTDADDDAVWTDAEGSFVPRDKIVGVLWRSWRVGDAVRYRTREDLFGKVVAIFDNVVLVKLSEHSLKTGAVEGCILFHCNEIEISPVPVKEPPAVPGSPHAIEAADLGEDDDGASPQEDLGRDDPSPLRGVPL